MAGPSAVLVAPVLRGRPGPPGEPGEPGPPGAGGDGAQAVGESPTGTQDGINSTFALSQAFRPGSTSVFRNGLREQAGVGYAESSPQIVFTTPPLSSDLITVDYIVTS